MIGPSEALKAILYKKINKTKSISYPDPALFCLLVNTHSNNKENTITPSPINKICYLPATLDTAPEKIAETV